ncbi:MAG: substrate-binding domain-containing protein, partial [Acidimicrobiales bacterium]
ADLQLLLVDTGEHAEEEVRAARTLCHEVDGFVVLSPRRLHRELGALGSTPAVFVNRPVRGRASVVIRTARAVDDAVRHLVGHSHVGLAYLGGPKGSWAATERRDAARRTSRDTGIVMHEVTVGAPTFEAAASTVDAVVASGATAVLAFNGQMALGVIAGLAQRGIAVPGDVSVVGGDDVPMAAMTAPPLTAISVPTGEAGARAVELLRSDGPRVELAGTLVVRGSTGPITS